MNVFLLKDVVNIGSAGQIIKVSEGYARNFLFPKKLAVIATEGHVKQYKELEKRVGEEQVAQGVRVATYADAIKRLVITLKRKINDKGRLYGAISADDIVELLKAKNIAINRKQVEFPKAIRTVGEYEVEIRLNAKLRPVMKIVIQSAPNEL